MATGRLLQWRFGLETSVLRAARVIIPLLPWELVRMGAYALGTLASVLDVRGKKTARENLSLAFPDKSEAAIRKLSRKCYQNFTRCFAELFWSSRIRPETLSTYFQFAPVSEATQRAMETGAVMVTPHAGNFEWLCIAQGLRGFHCLIVAENFKNPDLTSIFKELRESSNQTIIPQEGAVLKMFKHLRKGGCVALLSDLSAPPEQTATVITCWGRSACVTMAHAALAQRSGRPIVPAVCLPLPDGRYEIRFLDPISVSKEDSLQAACQQTWDVFEEILRSQPECWLWIYKHWRYLPPQASAGQYPSYAHPSKKFNKLLNSVTIKTP